MNENTAGTCASAHARHRAAPRRDNPDGVRGPSVSRRALDRLDPPDAGVTPAGRGRRGSTPSDTAAELSAYEPGELVRWKRRSRNWRYGRLADPPLESDGSLRVFEDGTGAARSLRPSQLERQVRGPRGALKWAPCPPTDTSTKQTRRGTNGVAPSALRTAQTTQGLGR